MTIPHNHHHGHERAAETERAHPYARPLRYAAAALVLAAAVLSACFVLVDAGESVVVTRFGDPVRVLTEPGLAWKMPAPVESSTSVDLRLRTTSSGLHDVGTKDGLRILVQAYIAWNVPDDSEHVLRFLRAVRNQPDEAARQLRSLIGSSLEITTSSFDLADLVNTDPQRVQQAEFEKRLKQQLQQALEVYGINVQQVGIERLTLPTAALAATVARMKAERETVAAERVAEGQRMAAEIRSNADRDARILESQANVEAAAIEAKSRLEAAEIYGRAYANDPQLYTLVRSLDTLDTIVNQSTRLILRTDAEPFKVFVNGPTEDGAAPAKPTSAPQ